MKIFAIGDLHLPGKTSKTMDIFGENWRDHQHKIEQNWNAMVGEKDLVLIPGDLSWAMTLEEAEPDLAWIGDLPGKKAIIRGNHDFWWKSISLVKKTLHESIFAIQNESIVFNRIGVAGTRLWEDPELDFDKNIEWIQRESIGLPPEKKRQVNDEKVFNRELARLKMSLESIPSYTKKNIVMLHFPPTDFRFQQTRTTMMLEEYGVDVCVFGHLHSLKDSTVPKFPVRMGSIDYYLVSCDFLDYRPVRVM